MPSIGDRILDILGQGGNRKFYMRDFKNAGRFQPGVDPVRHKFQGYVNFVLNRDLFASLYGNPVGENEFRTTISSLVRTAQMPGVQFQTETLNEYNRKKIVNTGVQYDPVNMTVYDTVGNEWLTLLMKYFSYHYMNPRNKNEENSRDIAGATPRFGGYETIDSVFADEFFNSNRAGYNTNITANFFERIDYVLYHGNRGVQYSIINPVLTGFRASDIDYGDSGFKDFELSFEYESFTVYNKVNFGLGEEDVDRFENVRDLQGPAFAQADLPIAMRSVTEGSEAGTGSIDAPDPNGTELLILGSTNNERYRSLQPAPEPGAPGPSVDRSPVAVFDGPVSFAPETSGEGNTIGELLGGVADAAITAAINNRDVGDAVLGTVATTAGTFIGESINSAITSSSPNQGSEGEGGG